MSVILDGRKVAKQYQQQTYHFIQKKNLTGNYVSIYFLGDNEASRVYVSMKRRYAKKLGLAVKVLGQQEYPLATVEEILQSIAQSNEDPECVGAMVQLPLPEHLLPYQAEILGAIAPPKDIDGLGGVVFGQTLIGLHDFLPATPLAVINLLRSYRLDVFAGKKVAILGQSNIVGKPLAMYLMQQGATVFSFNHQSNQKEMQHICRDAHYIMSCTGQIHLVNEQFIRKDGQQVLVDIGRGKKDGKPVGDMDFSQLSPYIKAYTPVPGGVGPMTIASLFWNISVLYTIYNKI